MNKIMMLKEAVNGYKVVTNPSVLSTEILGDLLWWFHKYGRGKDGVMDINTLRLSQDAVVSKLAVVENERKQAVSADKTAMDYLKELAGGLDSLPLVELLNKMGLGLQIYNDHTKQEESWLLGLAPDFPKGKRDTAFRLVHRPCL